MEMIKKVTYGAPKKDVLLNPDNAFRVNCQIGNTGISNNSDGRKIIPAGTPVGNKSSNPLEDRKAVLTVMNSSTDGANAQGILFNDVDVTDGNNECSVIFRGEVDLTKCPTIDATAKTALKHIIFVKGE